jgi:branched-chain amino acid transport system permease protein
MTDIFGVPLPALMGQLTLGLISGSFYAMLSLGLAIIFGLLNVVNFTHGAQFTLGAFGAWALMRYFGIPYWGSRDLARVMVGLIGVALEKTLLRRLYGMSDLYQLLLTFGMALVFEGLLAILFGSSGLPYENPMPGGFNLGFMFLPYYRAWVITFSIFMCAVTWFAIERTRLGAYLRAATEKPELVRAFGVNVPRMITITYGMGVALAALAGVLAAPMDQVKPSMGTGLIITVFAVVVIGGMGSLFGAVLTGFGLGIIEALTKVYYPQGSSVAIFLIMTFVLLLKPSGLFGKSQ